MKFRSAATLLLSFSSTNIATASTPSSQKSSSQPSWQKFGTNVNYRITAILDVNGGADAGPSFESQSSSFIQNSEDSASHTTQSTKTPGYSIPIDVITLQDPTTGEWRQRVSYYSGVQVDYNTYGQGYKVVPTPYAGIRNNAERGHDPKKRTCFFVGGNSTDVKERVGYLNFFPTLEQMEHYRLGKLVTSEPGIPYRIASLEAPHGSYNATSSSKYTQPSSSYDAHPGMPKNDWFQFHYQESLSSSGYPDITGNVNVARPLKWTMLARNQIINAHTENWVVRYLSYDAIDEDDERELWENWLDAKFEKDCGEEKGVDTLAEGTSGGEHHNLKLNRLGMFFSTSSSSQSDHSINMMSDANFDFLSRVSSSSSLHGKSPYSHFDMFLARHNKHYPHPNEYLKRKEVHDANTKNIKKWNKEHAGKTTFVANEFLDLDVKEVMTFRGGHIPRGKGKKKLGQGVKPDENRRNLRQAVPMWEDEYVEVTESEETFTEYKVPDDFDPSTLPESFDWREHLPGSVSPIKDQGVCGSCWAFSFISALESHWFITHGQSVDLPEQFVNDCAWSDYVHACDGGESAYAASSIIERFGGMVPTRDVYGGYLSVDGGCYIDILKDVGVAQENSGLSLATSPDHPTVQLVDWVVLPPRDDNAVKHALFTKGPLSIALNVVDEALYYSSGVLDVASCVKHDEENLDHAINLIGWGTDVLPDGTKSEHWILRNSWSDLWGDSGNFKVRMGDRDCGVTTSVGYPVVVEKPAKHTVVEPLENVATS